LISNEYTELAEARMHEPGVEVDLDRRSEFFKALGDRNRQKILHLLRGGELCVSDLLPHFDILQPTVSTHLLLLEETGLLKVRRDGRRRLYSISDVRIYDIMDSFYVEVAELVKSF
jgi:ArsR family transcriptional regulator, arsenate/arsenite/antimonite-responsive transcriptional repressor